MSVATEQNAADDEAMGALCPVIVVKAADQFLFRWRWKCDGDPNVVRRELLALIGFALLGES